MRHPEDVDAFVTELGKTAELLGEAVSEARTLLYFEALSDLPLEAVFAGLVAARRTRTFFPKPAEVREAILGAPDDRAAQAWLRLLTAVETIGTGESVDFADPALHAAIEAMGGWRELWSLARLGPKELSFQRRDFTQLYLAFLARLPDRVPPVLVGDYAAHNALTRGAWTRGLDHVDFVHVIGEDGGTMVRKALPVPATAPDDFLLDKG